MDSDVQKDLLELAKIHYENFPVGSFLLPSRLRRAIHLVYAFARVADDIADEDQASTEERLDRLDWWERQLVEAVNKRENGAFFPELAKIIETYAIPVGLFTDLLQAFRMDARGECYDTFDSLLYYCKHSADPVGRIVLCILGQPDEKKFQYSDAICSALQLTNFWQDLSIDTKRNRFYLPEEDRNRFGVSTSDLLKGISNPPIRSLIRFQVERTRSFFEKGEPLLTMVHGGFGTELKVTWLGGMKILDKIERLEYATLERRPHLSYSDKVLILMKALVR